MASSGQQTWTVPAIVLSALLAAVSCQGGSSTSQPLPGDAPEQEASVTQSQHDRRVDYVEFQATDLPRIKQFYSSVFGWTFTDYGPDYTSFSDGRLSGGFQIAAEVASGGPLVVMFAVDLEKVHARVREAGGRIVKETFEFPGGRRFHFADPSGNVLAVWSDR